MAAIPAFPSGGCADSTDKGRKTVRNLFEQFRNSSDETRKRYPQHFEQLPEEILCREEVWQQFLHWLLYEHVVKTAAKPDKGKPESEKFLKADVALQYLSSGINQAGVIWKTKSSNPATALFFTCLDKYADTAPSKWFQGMKHNAARLESERMKETGVIDKSATPVGFKDMQRVMAVFSKDDSAETSIKALSALSLWSAAGRSGELKCLHWGGMRWDSDNNCVVAQWHQVKTSKIKTVVFMAGANDRFCWFVRMADYFILSGGGPLYECDSPEWIFPHLRGKYSGIISMLGALCVLVYVCMHVSACMY